MSCSWKEEVGHEVRFRGPVLGEGLRPKRACSRAESQRAVRRLRGVCHRRMNHTAAFLTLVGV